jgi:S1-C subfamily serine protease
MLLTCALVLLLPITIARAQDNAEKFPLIDEAFLATTFIEMFSSDTRVGSGTGFFYKSKNKQAVFLVTNRHVVVKEKELFFPDRLRLRLHADPSDLRSSKDIDVPLYGDKSKRWKLWKEIDASVDLVAIEITTKEFHSLYIKPLSSDNLVPPGTKIGLAEPLVILGYPAGFFDETHNLPVARQGAVASAYPVPFRGESFFLVDAILHPGMSGSPVFTRPWNTSITLGADTVFGRPPYLIGINSGYYGNLNLNSVWFAALIKRLVE